MRVALDSNLPFQIQLNSPQVCEFILWSNEAESFRVWVSAWSKYTTIFPPDFEEIRQNQMMQINKNELQDKPYSGFFQFRGDFDRIFCLIW